MLSRAKYAAHHHQVLDRAKEQKIDEVRKANQGNQEQLRKFAYEMGADPFWQLLAERPLALAQGELARSDENLARTKSKTISPEDRDLKFQQTDRELVQALAKLDELKKANQQLAQDRLDQAKDGSVGSETGAPGPESRPARQA